MEGWKGAPSVVASRTIVVEVCPNLLSGTSLTGGKEKTEREVAERMARLVAEEIIGADIGSVTEDTGVIAQIGSLPDEIQGQPPTLQRAGTRAWLL